MKVLLNMNANWDIYEDPSKNTYEIFYMPLKYWNQKNTNGSFWMPLKHRNLQRYINETSRIEMTLTSSSVDNTGDKVLSN